MQVEKQSSIISLAKNLLFVAPRRSNREIDEPFRKSLCHNRSEKLIEAREILTKLSIPTRYDESKMDMNMLRTELPVNDRVLYDYIVIGYKLIRGIFRKIGSFFSSGSRVREDEDELISVECKVEIGSGDSSGGNVDAQPVINQEPKDNNSNNILESIVVQN